MAMTLHPIEHNGFRITQEFQHPAVYLDHWAIRHFAENLEDQDRFIKALHRSHGLWLFSTANLFEFVAMTDLSQAEDAERLIQRALASPTQRSRHCRRFSLFAREPQPWVRH